MKPTDEDGQLIPPGPPEKLMAPLPVRVSRKFGLRPKFVIVFSFIFLIACSILGLYYVEESRNAIARNLEKLGTILLTSVLHNEHFRYAGLVAEDRVTIQQFMDGLLAVEEVVYVVITRADGSVLVQHTKGARQSSSNLERSTDHPLYPDVQIAKQLFQSSRTTPLITPLSISYMLRDRLMGEEIVYDFAMPVLQTANGTSSIPPFSIQLEDGQARSPTRQQALVSAVVQIGLSDARGKLTLASAIEDSLLLTTLMIVTGALSAYLLTLRITKPLRQLVTVTQQVTEGRAPLHLTATTHDEVADLIDMFNQMTRSLEERNFTIAENMSIIKRQLAQLTTLHQVSAAIAATPLTLNQILKNVLQLLLTNLGFTRMFLMLQDPDRHTAYLAEIVGFPPDIAENVCEAPHHFDMTIENDGSLQADLLIHGKPLLVSDLEAVTERMHPAVLNLVRRTGITSFVAVPLLSHSKILGYIAADRNSHPCTEEDVYMLLTIAGHVASAIDNAKAYGHLAELMQSLEQRIEERTKELSIVNERLLEENHRRLQFLSVASHELRTPLTAIRSFADNMRDGIAGPVTKQQQTYLTRIGSNLNRLTRIINQLLNWSHLSQENEALSLTPVCVESTAHQVADSMRAVLDEKSITLEIAHAEGLPLVQGDQDKLEQIFWNLIGNACKFTPPRGRITVNFRTTPEGFVQTCVADTGCGIDPVHAAKLFQEFSKVPSVDPAAQGAQLGLFITKNLVTMHQGTIWMESTPGAGTRFYFTMPVCSQPDRLKAERKD